MADLFPGEIRIGGKVPVELLEECLGKLNATGASVGAYDGPLASFRDATEVRLALDADGHLFLASNEAPNGRFADLEGFLFDHGIPYDRHSDARHGFKAECVRFRVGMKRPLEIAPGKGGAEPMRLDAIRPVVKELNWLVAGELTGERLFDATMAVIRHLDGLLPPEVELLPPLEIVG